MNGYRAFPKVSHLISTWGLLVEGTLLMLAPLLCFGSFFWMKVWLFTWWKKNKKQNKCLDIGKQRLLLWFKDLLLAQQLDWSCSTQAAVCLHVLLPHSHTATGDNNRCCYSSSSYCILESVLCPINSSVRGRVRYQQAHVLLPGTHAHTQQSVYMTLWLQFKGSASKASYPAEGNTSLCVWYIVCMC